MLGERGQSTTPLSARCWTPAWRSGRMAGRIGTGGGSTTRRRGRNWTTLTAVLGELTGHPVSRVAIPFGSSDRHVLRRSARGWGDPCVHQRRWTRPAGRLAPGPDQLAARLGRRLDRPVLNPDPSLTRRVRGSAARVVKRLRPHVTARVQARAAGWRR